MPKEKPKNIRAQFDAETRKWFRNRMGVQTTVECCEKCGLWYKPMLGHKCKVKGENYDAK
jgi:hypothetical protein